MPRAVRYEHLPTEQPHPRSRHLDRLTPLQLARLMHRDEAAVQQALSRALPQIARAISLIAAALRRGGRLILVGAGTSGRLAVLEAAECPPTFHTPPSLVQAIIAGGPRAVFRSQEGAEDNRRAAARQVRRKARAGDVVVGIAASGVTPFVDEALRTAARAKARTVLVTCHAQSRIPAQVRIVLAVGPEVLTGSTRLKAGTATKLALNMLTLGAMASLGKTYGNLMVDVRPGSRKLRARAECLVATLTGLPATAAQRLLQTAGGRVKVAVVMQRRHCSAAVARRRLSTAQGLLRRALA